MDVLSNVELLHAPDVQRIPMSYDDYLSLPREVRAEWVDGVVVVSPTATFDHGQMALRLHTAFTRDLPGTVAYVETTTRLARNRERIPDVGVLHARPRGDYPDQSIDGPPILLVEINSPSTRSEDWIRKSEDYRVAGVGQYWLLDPKAGELHVLELCDGEWREIVRLDDETPVGDVAVGEYGTVHVDLRDLLAT